MNRLESIKNILSNELENCNHVKDYLWGNAATQRKIDDYIIESVKAGVNVGDCIEWFKALLQDNDITDEYNKPIPTNTYSGDIHHLYDILARYMNKNVVEIN